MKKIYNFICIKCNHPDFSLGRPRKICQECHDKKRRRLNRSKKMREKMRKYENNLPIEKRKYICKHPECQEEVIGFSKKKRQGKLCDKHYKEIVIIPYHRAGAIAGNTKIYAKKCECCNMEYEGKKRSRYCSTKCRNKAKYLRSKIAS